MIWSTVDLQKSNLPNIKTILYLSQEDLVVTSLHEVLLEGQRVAHVHVLLDALRRQQLQLRVELGYAVQGQQEQQVEAQQLVSVGRLGELVPRIFENFYL